MDFSHTNSIFNSLHYCLFGTLSDNKLATSQDVLNNFERELIDRVWCKLVYSDPPFESQHLKFMDEVKTNFQTFQTNDNRAIQLAGGLRNKVDKLLTERNLFVEKVALLWGITPDEVLKWVDVDPEFFIHDIKVRDNAENNKPYDYGHTEYKLSEYVGLVLAAIHQTVVFCQDYLELYEQSFGQGPTVQEPEPTESVKKTRKKEQLTHKQQMVLAEILGLHQHPLLMNLKPKQRGAIVGELLNRSVDDTENMLNPETSIGDDKLNWNNEYDRGRVCKFLSNNGINLPC